MKLKDLMNREVITTQEPVRSGRNVCFWPVLLIPHADEPNDTIYRVADRYEKSCVDWPKDNTGKPMAGVCDILDENDKRIARFRHHPDHGWLEEVQTTWTVSSDYPSVKAALYLLTQGKPNVSVAMRLGLILSALLTGLDDPVVTKVVSEGLKALDLEDFLYDQKNPSTEEGAVPIAVWRILNEALSNEGNLLVAHPPSNVCRYGVDITYTLSTLYPDMVAYFLTAWKNEAHGQMCDELMNLTLVKSIWGHHDYSQINCTLISEVTHILFSERYGGGSGDSTRFTVKVSHIVEAKGNDKAEAVDFNHILRALQGFSRDEGKQAMGGALLAELDCVLECETTVELVKVEELEVGETFLKWLRKNGPILPSGHEEIETD